MSCPVDAESRPRYAVSRSDSWMTFDARTTLHTVHGKAGGLDGYIEAGWDPDGSLALDPPPRMHVDLLVEHLHSGHGMQDREMWKLIDSRRFPRIAADLRQLVVGEGSGHFAATGDITLAGRTRPYAGDLTFFRSGDTVTIEGSLDVDIRDFGLKPPSLLIMKVDPCVHVHLHLVARAT